MKNTERTEWSGIHKSPKGVVRSLETISSITRPWNDFLHCDAKDVGQNLEEQLRHRDGLRSEILHALLTEGMGRSRYPRTNIYPRTAPKQLRPDQEDVSSPASK